MLIPALFSLAQSSITVTFTAENANGAYCPFDAVEVHNMTQNWSQTLTYPENYDIIVGVQPVPGGAEGTTLHTSQGQSSLSVTGSMTMRTSG